jgi:serine/threonine protein kinase
MQSTDLSPRNSPTTIYPDQLFQGKIIATGSFGAVFKGKYRGKEVAIKLLGKTDQKSIEKFEKEYRIMSKCMHKNILRPIGFLAHDYEYKIIMEYMDGGNLTQLLQSQRKLSWVFRRRIVNKITQGLAYLHDKNLAHRDLKPDNILLTQDYKIKIGDLGSANFKSSNSTFGSFAGTFPYTAPEHLNTMDSRMQGSLKGDVYSLALTIWEICARTKPWGGSDLFQMVDKVLNKERPPLDKAFPSQFLQIIERGWEHDQNKRATINEIVELLENNPLPYGEKKFDGEKVDHPDDQLKILEEILAGDAIVEISFRGWEILTDSLLIPVLKNFPNLITLDLSHCHNLSAISLQAIADLCPNLRRLSICNWTQLFSIPNLEFPYLIFLEMENCCNLDALSLNAHRLTSLSLKECSSLKEIGGNLPALEELFINGCIEITTSSLGNLGQNCQGIRKLTMHGSSISNKLRHQVLLAGDPEKSCCSPEIRISRVCTIS